MSNHINDHLKKYEGLSMADNKKGPNSYRASLIKEFVDTINFETAESNKKLPKAKRFYPVTGKGIAMKLSHLSTEDIAYFLKMCLAYRSEGKGPFGKCFYGALKNQYGVNSDRNQKWQQKKERQREEMRNEEMIM